jgi:hypothetical protein
MRIGNAKNLLGGLLFALIGLMFAVIARGIPGLSILPGYSMGTPARMGPAFFPFWLGVILFVLGIIIAVTGIRAADSGEAGRLPRFHWRPIFLVLGSVVMFGMILKWTGMLIAGFLAVLLSSTANPEGVKWRDVVLLGLGLVIFCGLVFVGGLKLPIPLCPPIEAIQSSIGFCRG